MPSPRFVWFYIREPSPVADALKARQSRLKSRSPTGYWGALPPKLVKPAHSLLFKPTGPAARRSLFPCAIAQQLSDCRLTAHLAWSDNRHWTLWLRITVAEPTVFPFFFRGTARCPLTQKSPAPRDARGASLSHPALLSWHHRSSITPPDDRREIKPSSIDEDADIDFYDLDEFAIARPPTYLAILATACSSPSHHSGPHFPSAIGLLPLPDCPFVASTTRPAVANL